MSGSEGKRGFSTTAIHAGQDPENWRSGAVVPPIVTATTFKRPSPLESYQGYGYSRQENPTRSALEECLAAIEGAKHALTFASGLGAEIVLLTLLKCGDHLICSDDVYGGSSRLFRDFATNMGIEVTFTDFFDPENVRKELKPNTKMIWLESPTNPFVRVVDISHVCGIARSRPAIIVVVDNTFLTPYYQRPLELGAHVSMYSLTKYMSGHSDVLMGAAVFNDDELEKKLRFAQIATGVVPSPFDCYLTNRSLKTLALRMERHRHNSLEVARWLEQQPEILEVLHPELPSHPQYEISQRQSRGHSGIFSFRHRGGLNESNKLLTSLRVFTLADSLGGCESLISLPSQQSHLSVPADERAALGITDALVRVSVGLEDAADLISDFQQALQAAFH